MYDLASYFIPILMRKIRMKLKIRNNKKKTIFDIQLCVLFLHFKHNKMLKIKIMRDKRLFQSTIQFTILNAFNEEKHTE